jgi:hypothetical protein
MGRLERLYFQVLNTMLRILLRSPAHRLRSGRLALLEFDGRRSGRRYRIPVAYWQSDTREIVCLTSAGWARWWRNLDDAEATIWIGGRPLRGHSVLVGDPAGRLRLVTGFLRRNAVDLHHYGLIAADGGEASAEELLGLAESPDTKVIAITIEDERSGRGDP